jgi:SpoVK/Ycf46/Vps4 family AAA+-type ATPase
MRQFLTLSDGIIRDPGKKLIFSTNLPNIRDIDDALLRPGRCYDWIATRALSLEEASRLVAKLEPDGSKHARIVDILANGRKREYVLAEIYRAVAQANGVRERARRPEGFQSRNGEGSIPSALAL